MVHLIDKDALVAEIEKLEKLYCYGKSDGMLIAKSVFDSIKNIIDTLEVKEVQEEPKDKCKGCNNVKGCVTCVDGSEWAHYHREESVSEDLEDALAREWQGYNDRGAATVDALEDNTQELAFAKGFYRGAEWGKNQAKVEIQAQSMALVHGCPKESITEELEKAANAYISNENNYTHSRTDTFKAGAEWQKEQMKEALRTEYEKGRHDALEEMKKEE